MEKEVLAVDNGGQMHLPGGKREPCDRTPLCTAKRELEEETGLPKNRGDFRLLYVSKRVHGNRSRHDIYYFEAVFPKKIFEAHLKPAGEDGEITHKLTYAELRGSTSFNSAHLHVMRRLKLLRPPKMKTSARRRV